VCFDLSLKHAETPQLVEAVKAMVRLCDVELVDSKLLHNQVHVVIGAFMQFLSHKLHTLSYPGHRTVAKCYVDADALSFVYTLYRTLADE
jgi:hypothetical protein